MCFAVKTVVVLQFISTVSCGYNVCMWLLVQCTTVLWHAYGICVGFFACCVRKFLQFVGLSFVGVLSQEYG